MKERRWLDVPFADKDAAKAMGASWEAGAGRWRAPDGADWERYRRWWPREAPKAAVGAWLHVPFAENEMAKAAGARWDPEARSWYLDSAPSASHARWLPSSAPGDPRPGLAVAVAAALDAGDLPLAFELGHAFWDADDQMAYWGFEALWEERPAAASYLLAMIR